MRVVQEEIFGPVVVVLPFDDEDEGVALANDTDFGLIRLRVLGRHRPGACGWPAGFGRAASASTPRSRTPRPRSAGSSSRASGGTGAASPCTPTASSSRSCGRVEGEGRAVKGIVWTGALEVRDDVAVRDPRPHEVRVRIANAGLCHSDVSVVDGTIPFPTPVVLGHEGAGVVDRGGRRRHQGGGGRPRGAHHARQLRALRRLRPRSAHPLPGHDGSPVAAVHRGRREGVTASPTPGCSPRRSWSPRPRRSSSTPTSR